MANILQVANWMQEGKRVKRSRWAAGTYIYCDGFNILNQDNEFAQFIAEELIADDWEIAE